MLHKIGNWEVHSVWIKWWIVNEINDEIGGEMLLQRSNIRPISILNLSQLLHFCYDMHCHALIPSVILHTWKYFKSRSNWPKIGLHTIRRGRDLHKFASKCLCGRFCPWFRWNLNGLLQQSNLSKWFVYNRVTFCKLWHHAASAAAAYVKSKNGLDALLPQQIWNTFCKLWHQNGAAAAAAYVKS